ncbi:uncharacterized protein LOC131858476 [Cryptomeria japonica]|uniref:uncharacterized protein LOC131858476 n=1 Tax=Cryptomeria japonica TaxID=3369 RepID=UPI0027DAAED7|nr:uncharacterized protein LOC131858476 [Cryptomeria japonica]
MPPPKNISQLRILHRKIQAIHQFVAQLVDRTLPFKRLLKKDTHFKWNEECQKVFDSIKDYLDNPPIIMSAMSNRSFFLYISASSHALVALLAQRDDEGWERVVYYISFTLIGYESQYSAMEKKYLALVFATQKMRHYILYAETQVIAKNDNLKHLFTKSDLLGRLAKWVMLLSEFDLHFITQKSIKGQVIVDQLADAPSSKSFPTLDLVPNEDVLIIDQDSMWDMYFDGLRCQNGSGVGVVFISPEGNPIPLSFRLEFHCTNNIVEYEDLIVGLCVVIAMGVKNIHIHGDFELIVNQVTSPYRVKKLKLSHYNNLALTILKQFATYMINSISQRENPHADAMASAASLVGPDFGQDEYCFMVSLKGVIDDDSSHTLHLNQLELLDECRLKALQHLQDYQKFLSKQYNESVLPRTFKKSDLVLYEN